jgi:hypothetical protein
MGGKIDNIFDVEDEVDDLLGLESSRRISARQTA